MRKSIVMFALISALLSACVSIAYRQVVPGINSLGALQVTAGTGWNVAPSQATPGARPDTQTWTKDGLLLDRVVIIPAVGDGEALFKTRDTSAALPPFRSGMLPNEIEEITESTVAKLFGEGNAAVSTENLRPWRFAENRGVMFDLRAAVTDSPDYRGTVGAFIADNKLYMILFIAATPHYYDKHKADAEALIQSAALQVQSAAAAGN